MQNNNKTKELNSMNVDSLKTRAEEIRKELFLLRMKKFSAPEKNTSLTGHLRKSLARTLTILRQRETHGSK